MKHHYILILSALFLVPIKSHCQEISCGTSEHHQFLMETDSTYNTNFTLSQSLFETALNSPNANRNTAVVYRVPVVVHIIHLGEAVGTGTNITDSQVIDAIDYLNYKWSTSVGTGINIEVQFCLASRDPNGNATTGINRVNGSGVANYSVGGIAMSGCALSANESAVKGLSKWPLGDYYNIWVVSEICNGSGGVTGYASYPTVGNTNDGAVMLYSAMNSSYFTLPHELGHAFNLKHTFEGDASGASCPANTNCSSEGDLVCDTPPHKRGDCSTTNPCTATGTFTNSSKNVMSYCAGANRFTQGQKDRIRACFTVAPRMSLLNSLGCGSLGINQNQKVNLKIYPNPAKECFIINHDYSFSDGYVEVYNLLGVKLWQEKLVSNNQVISIANLVKGIYLINIHLDNFQHTEKLVVE